MRLNHIFVLVVSGVMLLLLYTISNVDFVGEQVVRRQIPEIRRIPPQDFVKALEGVHVDNLVVLALVDSAYLDVAVNFYKISIKAHRIDNLLFVGADNSSCVALKHYMIPCFAYTTDPAAAEASVYGSKDFLRKMNIRTEMIQDALHAGFDVLHTDIDVIFVKNPLPDLQSKGQFHIATLWDDSAYNAGFVLVRNNTYSRWIYWAMSQITEEHPDVDDQTALNRAIGELRDQPDFVHLSLDENQYQSGLKYFIIPGRYFAGDPTPCPECIVIHHNWIATKEAKIYRLKEFQMWVLDRNGYYSDRNARYLMYNNIITTSSVEGTLQLEKTALQNALLVGQILDRIVILPYFHCKEDSQVKCSLNSFLKIASIDSLFKGKYREHSFLMNPLVPAHLSRTMTPHLILTNNTGELFKSVNYTEWMDSKNVHVFHRPATNQKDIKNLFGSFEENILIFHSLYACFAKDELSVMENVFQKTDYIQIT